MKSLALCLIVVATVSAGASQAFAHAGFPHLGMHGRSGDAHGSQKSVHAQASTHQGTAAGKLAQNPGLTSRIKPLLPPDTNLQMAASGFKNLGQFVAAVHVSHNLHIPFDQLKAKMMGPNHESLGRAIQELRPNISHKLAKTDVKIAKLQAEEDQESPSAKEAQRTAIAQKR